MNLPLLQARQTKYVAYVTLYIAVVVAIITVANVLGDRYNKTYDATANKRYSLSEQTAKIVKGLKEPATIYYYDRPTGFSHAKTRSSSTRIFPPRSMCNMWISRRIPWRHERQGLRAWGRPSLRLA